MATSTNSTTAPDYREPWVQRLIEVRRHFDTDQQMLDAFKAIDGRLPETLALCGGTVTPAAFARAMKAIADQQ
jgi:hypothetical protein